MNKVNHKVILNDVRCSYVFATNTNKNDKYSVQPLIEKGSDLHKKLHKIQKKVLAEAFGEKALKTIGKYKLPLRDGSDEMEGEEYQGMMFFNANNGRKPGIVNRNNEPADIEDIEKLCYSGAYFHVSVTFYAFKSKDGGKPGVAAALNNLMLRKEGDRLDGSVSAESEFSEYAEDAIDDADDFDDDDLD